MHVCASMCVGAEHGKIAGARATPEAIQHAKDVRLAHQGAASAGKRGRNAARSTSKSSVRARERESEREKAHVYYMCDRLRCAFSDDSIERANDVTCNDSIQRAYDVTCDMRAY